MTRVIPYIVYLVLIGFHQELTGSLLAIGRTHLDLTALLVSLVALYKEDREAVWFAFAAAIVFSAEKSPWIGLHALVLTLTAMTISRIKFRLNLASQHARLLVVIGAVLIHETLVAYWWGREEFYWEFLTTALPSTAYTSVWAWLFFKIKDGQLTWTRIKEMF